MAEPGQQFAAASAKLLLFSATPEAQLQNAAFAAQRQIEVSNIAETGTVNMLPIIAYPER